MTWTVLSWVFYSNVRKRNKIKDFLGAPFAFYSLGWKVLPDYLSNPSIDNPAEILIFYRGAWTFRSIFAILTQQPILDISASFAISGLSMKIVHPFDFLVTHIKPQFPTL
jgi:hypothetical protein